MLYDPAGRPLRRVGFLPEWRVEREREMPGDVPLGDAIAAEWVEDEDEVPYED